MANGLKLNEIKTLLMELESEKLGFEHLGESCKGTDNGKYFEGKAHGLYFAIEALKRYAEIK